MLGTTPVAVFVFQVSLLIRRELTERAKDFSLILDDVAITELSFSREYTAAVEAKQVGEFHWCLKRVDCLCLFTELLNKEVEFRLVCHCCITVRVQVQGYKSLSLLTNRAEEVYFTSVTRKP